jgi:hypothetical protein
VHVKTIAISVLCDRCGTTVVKPDDYELSIGLQGCVTARADLCGPCKRLFHQWLGKSWEELHEDNKQEADAGGRPA